MADNNNILNEAETASENDNLDNNLTNEDYNGTMPLWMKDKWAGVYQQYVFYYKRMNK